MTKSVMKGLSLFNISTDLFIFVPNLDAISSFGFQLVGIRPLGNQSLCLLLNVLLGNTQVVGHRSINQGTRTRYQMFTTITYSYSRVTAFTHPCSMKVCIPVYFDATVKCVLYWALVSYFLSIEDRVTKFLMTKLKQTEIQKH